MDSGFLEIFYENHIAVVQFYHPMSNSLPKVLLDNLIQKINEISLNPDVRVIVLQSEGEKTFCAGASFDELLTIDTYENGVQFFNGFGKLINAMRTCNQPIIGRVQGKAVGGGVGLIAACDYVLATENASVRLSEISIAIGPFVVEPAITRKIGVAAVNELTFNPTKWKTAFWAKEKGLFAEVYSTLEELDREIMALASQIAQYSPEAVQQFKKIMWENAQHWDELLPERAKISGNLVLSEATKNALAQYKNKI